MLRSQAKRKGGFKIVQLLTPKRKSALARWEDPRNFYGEMEHVLSRLWEDGQDIEFGDPMVPLLDVSETRSSFKTLQWMSS